MSVKKLIVGVLFLGFISGNCVQADEWTMVKDKDEFILNWLICGPFPNYAPDEEVDYDHHKKLCWGYAHDFLKEQGGEAGINPVEGMECKYDGETIIWRKYESPSYLISFNKIFRSGSDSVAYAYCEINAPEDMEAVLGVGSDDGIKIWLNHKLVHDHHIARAVRKDADRVSVEFKKGKNQLLIKVDNDWGGFGFCLRAIVTEEEKKRKEGNKI